MCTKRLVKNKLLERDRLEDLGVDVSLNNSFVITLRTGLLNCLNARSRGLTFRHLASCIQGQAFRYSPENAFYIFNIFHYLIFA